MERFLGIDVGAETIKVVEILRDGGELRWGRRWIEEHHKEPERTLRALVSSAAWDDLAGAAVSGRFSRQLALPRVPLKQAQALAFRFLYPTVDDATIVSIGSHGFSVLELRESGIEVFRENSRCSQGTGNFLRQLVERFDLTVEQASALCAEVDDPAPLSGRCPVILKTDMTHLANKGEGQARILAGLYDAVCENVQVLIKPHVSPPRLLLAGGVSRAARIADHFGRFCDRHGIELLATAADDRLFLEALGSALFAADRPSDPPALDALFRSPDTPQLERLPGLARYLPRIRRMPAVERPRSAPRALILGFDIGSTGSKAVALDVDTAEAAWEGYINTNGNPVGAARALMQRFVDDDRHGRSPVVAVGATGSGREIVGSLLATCFGSERVYVLNEIAAHAEGAMHFDPRVDTIFEIGGQDAKYIRLADGRVIDAAMNEACSAGTGSFIEEQGRKFAGIEDVVQLGGAALSAEYGVSLGQHCSVFMAEIIDEAVAAGVPNRAAIAGIYDSIIQNYLNRVKGNRSVGDVIFCQGMPFSADALAAAVVRQTGSEVVIPPNPGTVGALGIALLTRKALGAEATAIEPRRFLEAEVTRKDTFVCRSKQGCGGAGNLCRIDRLTTVVDGKRQRFTWGGGCSLWDRGTGKLKLPDRAPDPFREREELVQQLVDRLSRSRGQRTVGISDEFQLKGLFPFFATFIHELGYDLLIRRGADQGALKRGIEEANVPFCAPMQQYHGLVSSLADEDPEFILIPMLRSIPRAGDEEHAVVCPIVQGAPDMLRWDLGSRYRGTIVSPVVDIGEGNLDSTAFVESCQRLAAELGVFTVRWWKAYQAALAAQTAFDRRCAELGQRALAFCREHDLVPVVVLGRAYTIYNAVLNSNVPKIVREQGSVAIPVDCYPLDPPSLGGPPVFHSIYWGYGQRNLRAAWQIRRTPGVYSVWCSNYSCGPDSFNIHFYSYTMEGKPFAIIETDGHSGDAGTKTRIEAFLHCVHEDLAAPRPVTPRALERLERANTNMPAIIAAGERVLIPRMGVGAAAAAACLRGVGIPAEALPVPDRETVNIGRRYTSGKECVPMCITLGSLLQRLEQSRGTDERFALLMPTADGPCRFGVYNVLHKITLERLGFADRVSVWSPSDTGYFDGLPGGLTALIFTGFAASDVLLSALHDVRPVEARAGAAEAIYRHYRQDLLELLEDEGRGDLSLRNALLQVANGRLFGCAELLRRAAAEFAAVKTNRDLPAVAVVGEIYVRCDPFANDYVIDKLEQRGIRARFAPFIEWLEYTDYVASISGSKRGFGSRLSSAVQHRIQARTYALMADALGWAPPTTVRQSLAAAAPYIRPDLTGEAVLTLGGPLHEWREGLIEGVVSVGPLECMPNKISEAQSFHVAERDGLLSLTIPLNGDPVDPEVLDNFAFEVYARWQRGRRLPRAARRQARRPAARRP